MRYTTIKGYQADRIRDAIHTGALALDEDQRRAAIDEIRNGIANPLAVDLRRHWAVLLAESLDVGDRLRVEMYAEYLWGDPQRADDIHDELFGVLATRKAASC